MPAARVQPCRLLKRACSLTATLTWLLLASTRRSLLASAEEGVIRLVMRKTKRPVLLPIAPKARAALDECRKRTVMGEYVLLTPEGKPYCESTIKRYFKTAKAIAGIKRRFRFHDQRHTFASTLASKGINSFTLRDLLGHASVVTTSRYARPSTEIFDAVKRALA